jgi:hypothetical protein
MYYRALVLAVNVYSAIGYSIGRPLKQGKLQSPPTGLLFIYGALVSLHFQMVGVSARF